MNDTHYYVISDLHLGYNNNQAFPPDKQSTLTQFMHDISQEPNCKGLILLGDTFDTWTHDIDKTPPDIIEIAQAHPWFLDAVRCIANAAIPVTFVRGNHDMDMDEETCQFMFSNHPHIHCTGDTFTTEHIHMEHGQRYDLFNAPNSSRPHPYDLPLGYYLSRIATTYETLVGGHSCILSYLDAILKHFPGELLHSTILWDLLQMPDFALLGAASLPLGPLPAPFRKSVIRLPEAQFVSISASSTPFRCVRSCLTGAQSASPQGLVEGYQGYLDHWVKHLKSTYGKDALTETKQRFRATLGGHFEPFIARLPDPIQIAVLGHTHKPCLHNVKTITGQPRIYANCGGVGGMMGQQYYVKISESENDIAGKRGVELWEMGGGKVECMEIGASVE